MTQKTTLPLTFTGTDAATLPKFIHGAPVTAGLIRRYAGVSLDSTQVGTTLASLPDLTGLGSPLSQVDPALQPTIRQSGKIRYLEFTADAMNAGATATATQTFAVVGKYRGQPASGNWPIAALGNGGGGAYSRNSAGVMASYGNAALTGGGNPGTAWHVFLATFDGAASVVRVDSTEVIGNAGTTPGGNLNLGINTSQVPESLVDIAEVLVWNRNLTLTERQKVVSDLKSVYGI